MAQLTLDFMSAKPTIEDLLNNLDVLIPIIKTEVFPKLNYWYVESSDKIEFFQVTWDKRFSKGNKLEVVRRAIICLENDMVKRLSKIDPIYIDNLSIERIEENDKDGIQVVVEFTDKPNEYYR